MGDFEIWYAKNIELNCRTTNTYIKIFITLQRHIYPMIAKFEKLFSSQGMDTEKKKSYRAAIKEAKTKPLEEFEKYA